MWSSLFCQNSDSDSAPLVISIEYYTALGFMLDISNVWAVVTECRKSQAPFCSSVRLVNRKKSSLSPKSRTASLRDVIFLWVEIWSLAILKEAACSSSSSSVIGLSRSWLRPVSHYWLCHHHRRQLLPTWHKVYSISASCIRWILTSCFLLHAVAGAK